MSDSESESSSSEDEHVNIKDTPAIATHTFVSK